MTTYAEFKAGYLSFIAQRAAEGDCHPHPAWILRDGDALDCHAIALGGNGTLMHLRRVLSESGIRYAAYGLDNYTKPDQGTTRSGVFVFTLADRTTGQVEHGILEYDGSSGGGTGETDEPCFTNPFWNNASARNWEYVSGGAR